MPTPFAQLAERANAAVIAHLSDAEGTVAGVSAQGLYTEAWEPATSSGLMVGGTLPAWTVANAVVPEDWEHAPVVITAGRGQGGYRITEVHPLDDGLSTLVLERMLS